MKKRMKQMLSMIAIILLCAVMSKVQMVSAANTANPTISARSVTIRAGKTRTLKVLPKKSSKFWKISKVTTSNKKVVKITKIQKKKLEVKMKGQKPYEKPITVKLYLKRGNVKKILTCKVRVIPAKPKLSAKKLTLEVGKKKTLKVLPSTSVRGIWTLKKVTASGKSVKIYSKNAKKCTIGIKAQKKGTATIKVQLEMKKSAWKKYKKYFKLKKTTLKCVVNVTNTSEKPDTSDTLETPEEPDTPDMTEKIDIDVSGIEYIGLTSIYDGTAKYVSYKESTLPKGISAVKFEGDGQTEAGTYNVTAKFVLSDTNKYEEVLPITIQMTINKATFEPTLNENSFHVETNQIFINEEVPRDISVKYSLNESDASENIPVITQPGRYTVATDISVTENYQKAPEPLKAIYNIKRSKTWYQLFMVPQVQDDKVMIEVYLKNLKLPRASEYTQLILGFDLLYDKDVLEFEYGSGFILEDGWEGDYNPNRNHDETTSDGAEEHDVIITYEDYEQPSLPGEKVCTIVYQIKPDQTLEDSMFVLDNPSVVSAADEELPFQFLTDGETINLNPTENVPEYTVYMNWDWLNDAKYEYEELYPEDKVGYIEALLAYLSNNGTGGN